MESISGKFPGYFRMGISLHSRNVLVLLDLWNGARSCIKVYSQGARFLKIDLAQLSSQKRFDFRNSKNYSSTTFLGTSYSQIVVAVFQ